MQSPKNSRLLIESSSYLYEKREVRKFLKKYANIRNSIVFEWLHVFKIFGHALGLQL